jgi:Mg2+ and Co2+ transporter CorA
MEDRTKKRKRSVQSLQSLQTTAEKAVLKRRVEEFNNIVDQKVEKLADIEDQIEQEIRDTKVYREFLELEASLAAAKSTILQTRKVFEKKKVSSCYRCDSCIHVLKLYIFHFPLLTSNLFSLLPPDL